MSADHWHALIDGSNVALALVNAFIAGLFVQAFLL
jgi:hypothetical protein